MGTLKGFVSPPESMAQNLWIDPARRHDDPAHPALTLQIAVSIVKSVLRTISGRLCMRRTYATDLAGRHLDFHRSHGLHRKHLPQPHG